MILTLKIKLAPNEKQSQLLIDTIRQSNFACQRISSIAWEKRVFNKFKLHHLVYHEMKNQTNLGSQVLVNCIAKVSSSYALDKKNKKNFREIGSIIYDNRLVTYKANNMVSVWAIGGRLNIPFYCHTPSLLNNIKGKVNLVFKKGKFYLHQIIEIKEEVKKVVNDFIGVDFGINDICVTSDGIKYSGETLNLYRENLQKIRSSIQAKADTSKRSTKRNARRLLKRLSGKEKSYSKIINHTISKAIVVSAKKQGKGICIENLKDIRLNSNRNSKKFKFKIGRWGFYQLRCFLEYKSTMHGVSFVVVNPAYTSKTCNVCKHIGERQNKKFNCKNCGNNIDADYNASINIATLGRAVNHVGESNSMCCSLQQRYSGLELNDINII